MAQTSFDIGKSLEDIKSRALTIQGSVGNLSNDSGGAGSFSDIADLAGKTLKSEISSLGSSAGQEQSILEKYAKRKELAESSAESTKKLIGSQAETAIGEQKEENVRTLTSEQESRRGFATNTALVRDLEDTGKKRIRDLEKARDELLLKADIAKADKMDALIVDEQNMITNARKDFLSSLTSIISAGKSLAEFETPAQKSERELKLTRTKQLDEIRANYGYIPGMQNAKTFEEAVGLLGPELKKDRDLERRLKEAQIETEKAAAAAKNNSVGGARLPAAQVTNLSDAALFPNMLKDLGTLIDSNSDLFGIISGRLPGIDSRRQKINADLTRTAQLVGKFMEGGVLRAEDIPKYQAMLPQLTDRNPEVAKYKLQTVERMLAMKYNQYISDFQAAGYDVSQFPLFSFSETPPEIGSTRTLGTSGTTTPKIDLNNNLFKDVFQNSSSQFNSTLNRGK